MTELYRLVYTSRNLLKGPEAEITAAVAEILATSQANNVRVGVTGALLFNGGHFAQVLEGPRPVIETTFERIQRDRRHSDVGVLQCEAVAERGFPNWSMAFVGQSAKGRALWSEMASRTGFDLSRVEGEDLFATLHAIVLAEESLGAEGGLDADDALTPASHTGPAAPAGKAEGRDFDRLRAELRATIPDNRQADAAARPSGREAAPVEAPPRPAEAEPGTEVAVLRAALAEERQRTTDLRRELDDARIALGATEAKCAALRSDRESWAGRIKALASLLSEHPGQAKARPGPEIAKVA